MSTCQIPVRKPDGRIHLVVIPTDSDVHILIKTVERDLQLEPDTFGLMIHGRRYGQNSQHKLPELAARKPCTAFLLPQLVGGMSPAELARLKNCHDIVRAPEPLGDFITITNDEEDMITGENDPNYYRAKMPCGHVIGPYEMTEYCKSVLGSGKFRFICPGTECNVEWPYFLVRHVACLTAAETKEFESTISSRYLTWTRGYQECPGCKTWCQRADQKTNVVQCLWCTNQSGGRPFNFCWVCLATCGLSEQCVNPACDGVDPIMKLIQSCPKTTINGVYCPSVRFCPGCGMYIKFKGGGCKHMKCWQCADEFCFICLKVWPKGRVFQGTCGLYDAPCKAAPVQEMPKLTVGATA